MRNSNTLTPENASGKATEAIGQATKIFEDTTKEYGQKFKEGYSRNSKLILKLKQKDVSKKEIS